MLPHLKAVEKGIKAVEDYLKKIDKSLALDESGRCRIFREWWHSNEDHSATPGSEE